jgi:hypothetical protein
MMWTNTPDGYEDYGNKSTFHLFLSRSVHSTLAKIPSYC